MDALAEKRLGEAESGRSLPDGIFAVKEIGVCQTLTGAAVWSEAMVERWPMIVWNGILSCVGPAPSRTQPT